MSFLIRPSCRFPVQCAATYEINLFQGQGTEARRIPRSCDPSTYRHGCDPPDSAESVVESYPSILPQSRRSCQYLVPHCSPHITAASWSRFYPIAGKILRKAKKRCVNGSSICADEARAPPDP